MNTTTTKGHNMTKMTRTEIKQISQDEIMNGIQIAFSTIDNHQISDEEKELLIAEMDKQMSRIEKLFGYSIGSWGRGC